MSECPSGTLQHGKVCVPRTSKKVGDDYFQQHPERVFINIDFTVKEILESIGEEPNSYDALIVKFGDGEYKEIWGMKGTVPNMDKTVWRLE